MPLIFNIRDAKFETKKDKIIIHIDEYNKGKSDLVFQLDEKVDEKEDVKKKKDLKISISNYNTFHSNVSKYFYY